MFNITDGKGFHITFENGWKVSVQFGAGNYCDNYDLPFRSDDPLPPSRDAEIAAWDEDGNWFKFDDGNEVRGNVTPNEILKFMNEIAAKSGETK